MDNEIKKTESMDELKKAGIYDKVSSLNDGINSMMTKEYAQMEGSGRSVHIRISSDKMNHPGK